VDTTGPSLSILELPSNALRRVGTGGLTAHYGGGHVVYSTFDLVLYRRPFDLDRQAFTGPAEVIARDVRWDAVPAVAVSAMGDVVYGVGLAAGHGERAPGAHRPRGPGAAGARGARPGRRASRPTGAAWRTARARPATGPATSG
jgi:hypothetical protein